MSTLRRALGWSLASVGVALLIRFVSVRVYGHAPQRTVVTDVVQGVIAGAVLAYFTASWIIGAKLRSMQSTVNGWRTLPGSAAGTTGLLSRAALAKSIDALNMREEQVYWETFVDGAGEKLSGERTYVLRFPPGGLPPNEASWSVTMGDGRRQMVENAIHRYSVGGRSGLVANADGSLDICIQHAAPEAAREANWLPAPAGAFMLWLRVYQPGAAILDGSYRVPSVVEVKRG